MANVTELTVANFKDTVTSKEVAIVDFWLHGAVTAYA